MKNKYKIIDNIFILIICLSAWLIILSYLIKNIIIKLILAVIIGGFCYYIILKQTSKNYKIYSQNNNKKINITKFCESLKLYNNTKLKELLTTIFSPNFNVSYCKNIFKINAKTDKYTSFNIYINFNNEPDYNYLINYQNTLPLLVIVNTKTELLQQITKQNDKISAIDIFQFAEFITYKNAEPKIQTTTIKKHFKSAKVIKKENTKPLLKASFVLYILSYFTIFKLFYKIFSLILLVLSIICMFAKITQNTEPNILKELTSEIQLQQ